MGNRTDFIQTYSPRFYDNPCDLVRDYQRVQRYAAANPNQGSYTVSKAVGLPRGRIRAWVDDDGMPDCYRGLQTALSQGWIIERWDNETGYALNCLAAWIISSGSINKNWVPTFVADDDRAATALRRYASSANARLQKLRARDEHRATEWRPRNNASVLGRVLYTWTGIKGDKQKKEVSFPEYLGDAPDHITRAFAQIYVQQRGVYRDDRGEFVQISVTRNESFFRALKACLQRLVENEDDIRGDGWPLRIYGDAIETLRQYPEIPEE